MDGKERITGLCYDKMVYDYLASLKKGDAEPMLIVAHAHKKIGLNDAQIRRGIHDIRVKGYPVISHGFRHALENEFKFADSPAEYAQWREKIAVEIARLQDVLALCDAAATARFGPIPVQTTIGG